MGPGFRRYGSGKQDICFSLEAFDGSFVGFWLHECCQHDATSRFSHQWWILWCSQKFSVPSLLTRTIARCSRWLSWDAGSWRVGLLWRFGLWLNLGQEQCLDNFCWIATMWWCDSVLVLIASPPAKGSRLDRCLECERQESLTGVGRSRLQWKLIKMKFQAENKGQPV